MQPWKPQPRQRRTGLVKQRVIAVVVALVVGGWVLFAFSRFASKSPDKVRLGARVFDLGSARGRASTISRTGPLFFNDLIKGGRTLPIVVMYVGMDPGSNGVVNPKDFVALNAIPPIATPSCPVEWVKSKRRLVQTCTKIEYQLDGSLAATQTAPINGAIAMERFEVTLGKKGRLIIDLNRHFDNKPPVDSVSPTIALR